MDREQICNMQTKRFRSFIYYAFQNSTPSRIRSLIFFLTGEQIQMQTARWLKRFAITLKGISKRRDLEHLTEAEFYEKFNIPDILREDFKKIFISPCFKKHFKRIAECLTRKKKGKGKRKQDKQ
jgi:hypothetical protein